MSELIAQLRVLLDEATGNYINVAKVRAILDRHEDERDPHAGHARLWINGQWLCDCGEWMPGMASIAIPVETSFIRALQAAVSAAAQVLESDERGNLNALLEAGLIAALKEYGVDPGDWFAEAYGPERPR